MTEMYEPEIGQMLSGNSWSRYDTPEWIIALLERLADEIWRVTNNNGARDQKASAGVRPTDNEGSAYVNDVFEMRSYYWGEDCLCENANGEHGQNCIADCPSCRPNFKCDDFEVRWYKHARRGASCNRIPEPAEGIAIFERCFTSVKAQEKPLWLEVAG